MNLLCGIKHLQVPQYMQTTKNYLEVFSQGGILEQFENIFLTPFSRQFVNVLIFKEQKLRQLCTRMESQFIFHNCACHSWSTHCLDCLVLVHGVAEKEG